MVLDLTDAQTLWRLFLLAIWSIMFMAVGFAIGFKDGRREGLVRGKSIGRHVSNAARK